MAFLPKFCTSAFACFRNISLKVVSVALVGIFIFVVGLLSVQVMLSQPLVQKKLSQKISDWTGGKVSYSGALEIRYFPQFSVHAKQVFLRDVRRLPKIDKMRARSVTAKFQWWPLLIGRLNVGELILDEPEIYLTKSARASVSTQKLNDLEKQHFQRILKTIKNIPFTEIHCDNALLVVPNGKETGRDLYKFTAHISKVGSDGSFSGRGYFNWHDKTVHIAGHSATTSASLANGLMPFDITLHNGPLNGRFIGKLDISGEKVMTGHAVVKDLKSRKIARWFGVNLKGHQSLANIDILGDFKWIKEQIEFKKAILRIDHHQANGRLLLNYKNDRPELSGSITFKDLILRSSNNKSIFGNNFETASKLSATSKVTKIATNKSKGLVDLFDVDLRLSANRMTIDDTQMDAVVGTLLIKNGSPQFHLADAKVFGGRAYGFMKADHNRAYPSYTINMNLKGVQCRQLAIALSQKPMIDGRSDIQFFLTSRGNSQTELLGNVNGKVMLTSASAGHIGLDFSRLFQRNNMFSIQNPEQRERLSGNEWGNILQKKTPFERMTAKLVFHSGMLKSNRVYINERGYLTSILGQADLVQRRMRWLFDRKAMQNGMVAHRVNSVNYGIEATRRVIAFVEGELENPTVKRQYIAINAALADGQMFLNGN